jgi:hypothetical protein
MSRRTRRLLLLWLTAATVAGLVTAWLLWPRPAITRENAAKIQVGMTSAEVEAILGGPPRNEFFDWAREDTEPPKPGTWIRDERVSDTPELKEWHSQYVYVVVRWDDDGRVRSCQVTPMRPAHPGVFLMLRRWLGL